MQKNFRRVNSSTLKHFFCRSVIWQCCDKLLKLRTKATHPSKIEIGQKFFFHCWITQRFWYLNNGLLQRKFYLYSIWAFTWKRTSIRVCWLPTDHVFRRSLTDLVSGWLWYWFSLSKNWSKHKYGVHALRNVGCLGKTKPGYSSWYRH